MKDFKNIMMLAYYRNNLVHVFINDAYISCALEAFGESVTEIEGVPL
jgi:glycerol-3-phosphate O-acyltransferase